MKKVTIYTDGACSVNPGKGGWAAVLMSDGYTKEISGFEENTTNNRMELTAAVKALEQLKKPCEIELWSDSAYLVNAFILGWIEKWKECGWKKGKGGELLNHEIWQRLYELASKHRILWSKVKGHSDNKYNKRCDELATAEISNNSAADNVRNTRGINKINSSKNIDKSMEEKTFSRKHIYKGNIITVESLEVTMPDGRRANRDLIIHPGASVIIPLSADGMLYLVRQYRKPVEKILLELPAGKLDNSEDPIDCARRELKEETGLTAKTFRHIGNLYSTPGFSNEILYFFLATGLKEGALKTDADEFIICEKIPIDELVKMVFNGGITDAKTAVGILMADKISKDAQPEEL